MNLRQIKQIYNVIRFRRHGRRLRTLLFVLKSLFDHSFYVSPNQTFGTVLSTSQRPLFSVIYMYKYKIENAKASSKDVKPVVVTIRIPIT